MKAISLWQPWASLWLSPAKIHETRSWPIPPIAPRFLLVHAAKHIPPLSPKSDERLLEIIAKELCPGGEDWTKALPIGQLVGVVELIGMHATHRLYPPNIEPERWPDDYWCGNFEPGRWAWERGRYHRFSEPIACVGRQKLFDVPWDDVKMACPAWVTP